MQKIHPFDIYVMLRDAPELKCVDTGEIIDIHVESSTPYSAQGFVCQIGDKKYIRTTTVNPITLDIY